MFQIPAILTRVQTMSDGGVRVVFDTQEIKDANQLSALFALKGETLGYLLFKEGKILESEVPDEEITPEEQKSPAQRLRGVLFRLWEQRGKKEEFEAFYRITMDKFISNIKDKLT